MSSSTRKGRKDSTDSTRTQQGIFSIPASAVTYCDLLESTIPRNAFAISSKEKIRNEVHESIRKRSVCISTLYRRTKGAKRYLLDKKKWTFHIFEEQLESITELQMQNRILQDEIKV